MADKGALMHRLAGAEARGHVGKLHKELHTSNAKAIWNNVTATSPMVRSIIHCMSVINNIHQ